MLRGGFLHGENLRLLWGPPPFTREHIWPNGFLKRGEFEIKFSRRANRTFNGDLVISDVCANCNNGPLSRLDEHACELYDRRFGKRVEAGEVLAFTYDYGLLMRWLLKVSYNSARTTGQDVEVLARYSETILSVDPCTPVGAVALVSTISPSLMMNPDTGETKRIYPEAGRCGPVLIPGTNIADFAVVRCVMINAFNFTLLINKSKSAAHRSLFRLASKLPGQILEASGHMRVGPPSMPAHVALQGIERWPGMSGGS